VIIEPRIFGDTRGTFFEAFNQERGFSQKPFHAAQINVSESSQWVLRGMHFQKPHAQAKLVWVLDGEVYDVALDLRPGSKTFGRWESTILSRKNKRQLYIPENFAHGFQVLSQSATFCYACSETYRADSDRVIRFDDPQFAIEWPEADKALLSAKDQAAPLFCDLVQSARP
jgi:dTDP-4-dehydrorhamnose 3,5-epimerase